MEKGVVTKMLFISQISDVLHGIPCNTPFYQGLQKGIEAEGVWIWHANSSNMIYNKELLLEAPTTEDVQRDFKQRAYKS